MSNTNVLYAVALSADATTGVEHFRGFNVRETASAAAVWRLRDGGSSGEILWTQQMDADGTAAMLFEQDAEIRSTAGAIYFEVVSGTVEGSIFVRQQ